MGNVRNIRALPSCKSKEVFYFQIIQEIVTLYNNYSSNYKDETETMASLLIKFTMSISLKYQAFDMFYSFYKAENQFQYKMSLKTLHC